MGKFSKNFEIAFLHHDFFSRKILGITKFGGGKIGSFRENQNFNKYIRFEKLHC